MIVAARALRAAMRQRAFASSLAFNDDTSASAYGDAFPRVPRAHGCAATSIRVASSDVASARTIDLSTAPPTTLLRFVSRDDAVAAARAHAGEAAAADAAHEAVVCLSSSSSRTLLAVVSPPPVADVELGVGGAAMPHDALRAAAAAGVQRARALKLADGLRIELPSASEAEAAAAAQACILTNYAFDRYKTAPKPHLLSQLQFECALGGDAVSRAIELAHGCVFARDVANERADEMNPERLEQVAKALASSHAASMQLTVIKGDQRLREEKLDLLAAVGQAARHGPRYVEIEYRGDPDRPNDKIAIVGKGLTYDTGGLNLKPTGGIEDMHMDKGGAAAVLGAAQTVARLGVRRNVVFVLAVAENAIGSRAYKPHAIVRSREGVTVQIANTDAEGRLVLADALSLVRARHAPHTIIDLATLTGACVVALGEYAAGVFTNSSELLHEIRAAGGAVGERVWHMPILPEHVEEIKNGAEHADLRSTGAGRQGGACTAAAFLQQFVGATASEAAVQTTTAATSQVAATMTTPTPSPSVPIKWLHVDIAGPAMYSKARGMMPSGGTGFGAQTISAFLANSVKL